MTDEAWVPVWITECAICGKKSEVESFGFPSDYVIAEHEMLDRPFVPCIGSGQLCMKAWIKGRPRPLHLAPPTAR
jgi:hypothetical protein